MAIRYLISFLLFPIDVVLTILLWIVIGKKKYIHPIMTYLVIDWGKNKTMDNKDFIWTDEFIMEYWSILHAKLNQGHSLSSALKEFKESKKRQPIKRCAGCGDNPKMPCENKYCDAFAKTFMDESKNYTCDIKNKILFTTEDGVDMVAGKDEYWFCDERYKVYRTLVASEQDNKKGIVQYSTEEKLNEYVLMNKPSLPLHEIGRIIFMSPLLQDNQDVFNKIFDNLKQATKQKQP